MTAWLFAAAALAAYRATRLFTADTITQPARWWLTERQPELWWQSGWGWLYSLVSCPWCVGFWIAGAAVWTVDRWVEPVAHPLLWWPALATVVGVLGHWLDD